jgi:translocation and assembly module TamA
MDGSTRRSGRRAARVALHCGSWLALAAVGLAHAGHVTVTLDGVEGPLHDAALAAAEISQYTKRDVTAAQARRLYERAADQIRKALEPYGYYDTSVDGELEEHGEDFTAVLHVTPGEPVKVTTLDIKMDGDADGQRAVRRARRAFLPREGQTFDHGLYEKSKASLQAALFANGYLDAQLVTHRVELNRGNRSAEIELEWKVGERYRFGATSFEGGQFPADFMQRYIPWREGDFYDQDELLQFQQCLVDADYFAIAQVRPDAEAASNGIVPIAVMLAPAKRTIYTGGIFIGTDTGPGIRGGVERRWVNKRGHKLKFETILAQRLRTVSALYQIPLPGTDNHSLNFGATYRDENTDTSESQTLRLAATDSRLWHAWNRTLGLQFLTGDFKVADVKGTTTLLYPEATLARKNADNPSFVRRGWSLIMSARAAQEGVLSDTSFVQAVADAKWIRGIGRRSRFIARGTLGATQVDDFDKLPPELRFFAGGDRSIRGYSYQTIGPRNDDDDVIGGQNIAVLSAEYEYYFTRNWGIATFVDTGDAFSAADTFETKVGAGLGLRWRSPVGMVRVDLGVPIGDDHASGVELHIVIGPDL